MSNIGLLKNQHSDILALVKIIDTQAVQNLNNNAKDIAYNISALSGKLKMHLMSEDKFLYPHLMNSQNKQVSDTAHKYNREMGGLAEALNVFVEKYNTLAKILHSADTFPTECKNTFQLITDRINREDSSLYPLIEM